MFLKQLQEGLHGAVELLAAQMNDAERAHQGAAFEWDRHQPSLFDVHPQHAHGQDADAGAQRHGLFHGLDVVEVHDDVHVHAALAQVALDLSAHAQVVVEGHEILPGQVRIVQH